MMVFSVSPYSLYTYHFISYSLYTLIHQIICCVTSYTGNPPENITLSQKYTLKKCYSVWYEVCANKAEHKSLS